MCGPGPPALAMPSVKTDEPDMPSADAIVPAAVPPDDEREAEEDQAQPEDEEHHHGRRTYEREHAVAHLVVREPGREPVRQAPERARQAAHDPRRSHAGYDESGEDAPRREHDDGDARDECDQAGELHVLILPDRRAVAPARGPPDLAGVVVLGTSRSMPTALPASPPRSAPRARQRGARAAARPGPSPGCRGAGSTPHPNRGNRGRRS